MNKIWEWLPAPRFLLCMSAIYAFVMLVTVIGWIFTGGNCG